MRSLRSSLPKASCASIPLTFECVTALAFEVFARERVEFAVIEVGLGGRLDATNIHHPVGHRHHAHRFRPRKFPGPLLEAKSPVRKRASSNMECRLSALRTVPGSARNSACSRQRISNSPMIEPAQAFASTGAKTRRLYSCTVTEVATGTVFSLAPQLLGSFQLQNALNCGRRRPCAAGQDSQFRKRIYSAGSRSRWPGRLEKLQSQPGLYLDGAHNPSAARELAHFLQENFASRRKVILIYAAMRDKAVDEVAGLLFPLAAEVIFTQPNNPRAISAAQLAQMAGHHAAHFSVVHHAEAALDHALCNWARTTPFSSPARSTSSANSATPGTLVEPEFADALIESAHGQAAENFVQGPGGKPGKAGKAGDLASSPETP